jgi:hypothetical protein
MTRWHGHACDALGRVHFITSGDCEKVLADIVIQQALKINDQVDKQRSMGVYVVQRLVSFATCHVKS